MESCSISGPFTDPTFGAYRAFVTFFIQLHQSSVSVQFALYLTSVCEPLSEGGTCGVICIVRVTCVSSPREPLSDAWNPSSKGGTCGVICKGRVTCVSSPCEPLSDYMELDYITRLEEHWSQEQICTFCTCVLKWSGNLDLPSSTGM